MAKVLPFVLAALVLGSCADVLPGASAQGPESDPGRFRCEVAADCLNSCRYGAVNAAWYHRNEASLRECEDGCANQVSGPPRCEQNVCVAYYGDGIGPRSGTRRDECTRRTPLR
jgi:hypothetical protein